MKKHIRKTLIFIILLLAYFILDYFFPTYFVTLFGGFMGVRWYTHILIFFGSFGLVILLHELAHAFAFLMKGITPKMVLILIFLFYKEDKWHVRIDPKLIILGGGMVMPDFGPIHSEIDVEHYKKATSFSLMFAPVFTIVFSSLLFGLNIFFLYNIPLLTVFNFYILIFSLFFTYTSTLSAQGIYGDFVAHKKVMTDPVFSLSIVSQFVDDVTPFHYGFMKSRLMAERPSDFSIHLINFYSTLLEKGIYDDTEIDVELLEKAKVLATHPHLVRKIIRNHQQLITIQQTIVYLYRCQEDTLMELIYDIFKSEIEQSKFKESAKTYYLKQTAHFLNRADESDYLTKNHDFSVGLMDFILSHLPEYQNAEKERLQPIERFEKKEMIHLDNIELM